MKITQDDCSVLTFNVDMSKEEKASDNPIEPTIDDGENCTSDAECISGKCDSNKKCLVSSGKPCSNSDECAYGICEGDALSEVTYCRSPIGGNCLYNGVAPCGTSLECICGKCSTGLKSTGEQCTKDCECLDICIDGKCANKKSNGSVCTEDRECSSGFCYSGLCSAPLKGFHEYCIDDSECTSGKCVPDEWGMDTWCGE